MRISRVEAIRRVERKILQFRKILEDSNFSNLNSEEYQSTRNEAGNLLADIFSEAEARRFHGVPTVKAVKSKVNNEEKLQEYREEIRQYIKKLEDYKERIRSFWFNGEIANKRKIVEKALLLMRFYQEKEICKIGKKMKLPYFDQVSNCKDMSYHRSALEISRAIEDKDLLWLVRENPPNHGLSLGGFQGEYYSATENGKLELEGSWENVRENVQQGLGKPFTKA